MATIQTIHKMKELLKLLDPEDRLKYFSWIIISLTQRLRDIALTDKAITFLDTPGLFEQFTCGKELEECWWHEDAVEAQIKTIKKFVNRYRDGEMAYCVEEDFLNGVFKAMRTRVKAHKQERKRRVAAWSEELIATVLAPCRAERFAKTFGMEPMDWLIQNEGGF